MEAAGRTEPMKKILSLQPIPMTAAVMTDLAQRNLIIRLGARRHDLPAGPGQTLDRPIYRSADRYGPHMLISVTVNRVPFADFATHPDNEDFLLLGDPGTKPLYLVVALMRRPELAAKVAAGIVSPADFVCLHVTWNDPEVSFFTMLADVPHGEAITAAEGRNPTFYVTESRDLPNDLFDLGGYELTVAAT
ncbi:MAG: hypothetical protein QG602_556 [Verrucomicrobiota bacterium]|nr:hypothetical protein [Verrucomicrobiota bacterium]